MKACIIGGPKNGEWIETGDGAKVWLDIVHADTYVIRRITWTITAAKDNAVVDVYILFLAVHPGLTGPDEQAMAGGLLNLLAMTEFARAHGDRQEMPIEPPADLRTNGAVVLGPNGLPL